MESLKNVFILGLLGLGISAFARQPSENDWVIRAGERLLAQVSPAEGELGSIRSALRSSGPDYEYHWVRDAGVSALSLVTLYRQTHSHIKREAIKHKLIEYVEFSRAIQNLPSGAGVGEPKFDLSGHDYKGEWGRSQHHAPAIRAISAMAIVNLLQEDRHGATRFSHGPILQKLYHPDLAKKSLIKTDLEYISQNWRSPSFDLWEDVQGDHFFSRLLQRRALREGALLASRLGDEPRAVAWYKRQANEIEQTLNGFWDKQRKTFVATRPGSQVGGINYKHSNLDSVVVLGLLLGIADDDPWIKFDDPRILSTLSYLRQTFKSLYPINRFERFDGVAIGRYPEDRYGGPGATGEGNPWVLTTLAFAEAHFRVAKRMLQTGRIAESFEHRALAENYLSRVRVHAEADGILHEQIDRRTGHMRSAKGHSWSYAALISASAHRGLDCSGLLSSGRSQW